MLIFSAISSYLPDWLFKILFLIWGVFILFPISIAAGPIGRWFGRSLNEAAVAQAKAEREALAQRPLPGNDREG